MQLIMGAGTFTTTVFRNGSTCDIPLTFDPRTVFGKVRAPASRAARRWRCWWRSTTNPAWSRRPTT